MLILSPGALDRCTTEDDWLRREIAHALRTGANVVPVFLPGFAFPPELPEDLRNLPRHQGVDYSHRYFEAMIGEIVKVCVPMRTRQQRLEPPVPPIPVPNRNRWIAAGAMVVAVILSGIYFTWWSRTTSTPAGSSTAARSRPPEPSPIAAVSKPSAATPAPFGGLSADDLQSLLGSLPPVATQSKAPRVLGNPAVANGAVGSGTAAPTVLGNPAVGSALIRNAAVGNLLGTKWEIDGDPYTIEFQSGGAMNLWLSTIVEKVPPGHWTQTGEHVTIDLPLVSYQMTLSGDQMSGTQQALTGPKNKPVRGRRVR